MPSRPGSRAHARVLVVLLAIAAAALLAGPAIASAATISGTVTGKLPGGELKPLGGVKVTVTETGGGEILAGTATGAEGNYALDVPAGVYDVHFVPPSENYLPATRPKVEVGESLALDVTLVYVNSEEPEAEDTKAPLLTGLSLEPEEVDVSNATQNVVITLGVTDDSSGMAEAYASILAPSGKEKLFVYPFKLVAGSPINGSFEGVATFPQHSEAGIWRITSLTLVDKAGHARNYDEGSFGELGLPNKVVVANEEPEDTTPPALVGLSISPESIDTSGESRVVTVIAHVIDESGLEKGAITFESPSGESFAYGAGAELVEGTPTDGYYAIPVFFKQGSEAGEWKISNVRLLDKAFNEVNVPLAELEGAELPHTVTVLAAGPPIVSGVSPGSGPESGGTEVTISGSGFGGVSEVRFGTVPAVFEFASPSTIVAIAPPGTGSVDVTVTTPGGTSETSAADRFSYGPPVLLESSPNPSVHGQKVTFTAKVTPQAPGAPTPLGTVAFVEGSTTLGVANLKKGSATFSTTSLGAGKHPVLAVYSGDSSFGSSSSQAVEQVVAKANTEVTLTSSLNPAPYGSAATLKANVKALAPGSGTPAGTVTFREGKTVLATVQLSGANATYSLKTMEPAERPVTATYNGDPNNEPSESAQLVQAIERASTATDLDSSLNPAPYGTAGNLTATVDALAPSVATATGSVVFSEGEAVLASVPLTNGVAKYPLKSLDPGTHEITASYGGGANFEPSGDAITQVVVKATTETTLTSSLNPAPYGSAGTLKATVKAVAPGTGTPTGTVTFREGESVIATVPLSSGTAKYAFKSMAPGEHAITASYDGDPNYATSADVLTQTVVKASTSLTLTSTKNPAPNGSAGSLKATVKALAPGTGQPPSTVTFREGETVLAVVPLASGSASYPLKSLPPGSHEVTASYGGAANYEPSEDAITQVISP